MTLCFVAMATPSSMFDEGTDIYSNCLMLRVSCSFGLDVHTHAFRYTLTCVLCSVKNIFEVIVILRSLNVELVSSYYILCR